MTATGSPRPEGRDWMAGLGATGVNHYWQGLLDFLLHRLHSFRFLWLTQKEQIGVVWRWSGLRSARDRWPEMNHRRERQSVVFVIWRYWGYVKLYPFEITDYWMHGTRVAIERSYAAMMYQRHVSTEYNAEHWLRYRMKQTMPELHSWILSRIRFRNTKLWYYNAQCDAASGSAILTLQMLLQKSTSESTLNQAWWQIDMGP